MANGQTRTVRGAIKIENLPDLSCFKSFKDFVQALPSFLALEIPVNITNVIVSNIQPTDSQRDSVWFRFSNSGTFVGIYVFSGGAWRQIVRVPAPNVEVIWTYGDSREIDEQFLIVDQDNPHFTASDATQIMTQYIQDPTNTYYTYFAVTYEGA